MPSLPAVAIEAELIIRDPRVTRDRLWQAARCLVAGAIVSVIYVPFRVWLDGVTRWGSFRDGFTRVDAALAASIALVAAVAWILPMPNWVSVGPQGLQFRRWCQRRQYAWRTIESFGVGNPSDPQVAYVFVRSSSSAVEPIRLPAFKTVRAMALVQALQTKQKVFADRGTSGL